MIEKLLSWITMKNIFCWWFGHKMKRYPPLHIWENGKAVPLEPGPIFCERCGVGGIELIDKAVLEIIFKRREYKW